MVIPNNYFNPVNLATCILLMMFKSKIFSQFIYLYLNCMTLHIYITVDKYFEFLIKINVDKLIFFFKKKKNVFYLIVLSFQHVILICYVFTITHIY